MMTVLFSKISLTSHLIDDVIGPTYFENVCDEINKKHRYIETQNYSVWEKPVNR